MKNYLDDFICDTQCEEYYGHDSDDWIEGDISDDDDWDEDDLPDYID